MTFSNSFVQKGKLIQNSNQIKIKKNLNLLCSERLNSHWTKYYKIILNVENYCYVMLCLRFLTFSDSLATQITIFWMLANFRLFSDITDFSTRVATLLFTRQFNVEKIYKKYIRTIWSFLNIYILFLYGKLPKLYEDLNGRSNDANAFLRGKSSKKVQLIKKTQVKAICGFLGEFLVNET